MSGEQERLDIDRIMFGNAYTVNGKRVPPEDVVVHEVLTPSGTERIGYQVQPKTVDNLQTELCKGVETTIRGQDEFLTLLDELLDDTLHDDRCYIHPSDTECVCIIGRIRAVLPPCGAVVDKGNGVYWKCVRNAHPTSPDRHTYG